MSLGAVKAHTFSPEEEHQIDSLNTVINHPTSHDTSLAHSYMLLSEILYQANFDTLRSMAEKTVELVNRNLGTNPSEPIKTSLLKAQAWGYNNIGYYHHMTDNVEMAAQYYLKYQEISKRLNDEKSVAISLTNLGVLYEGNGKPDLALKYHQSALVMYRRLGLKEGQAKSLNSIGLLYMYDGKMKKSIEAFILSLQLREQLGILEDISSTLNNIGFFYSKSGDIKQALEYYHRSLKIGEELKDLKEICTTLHNIGGIYKDQGELDKALEYINRVLTIFIEAEDDKGIADSWNSVGQIYMNMGELDTAMNYFQKALLKAKEIKYLKGVAHCHYTIGTIHRQRNEADSALFHHRKSFDIYNKYVYKSGMVSNLHAIGITLYQQGKFTESMPYAQQSFELANEMKHVENIRNAARLLSRLHEEKSEWMPALKMHKLYIKMRDSINSAENVKAVAKQQAKSDYEKQKVMDDANRDKQKAIDDAKNEKQLAIEKEEKQQQRIITFATAGGLILVVVFLFFVFNRLRITRKQKTIIEDQKAEVEIAHDQLEEKNTEILDSINYAKRIQSAILPPDKVVKEYLKESFILYKPKDIVAGDFYWMEHVDNKVLFAAADCTGHGVPGALVSVVCNGALNRSVREHGLTDPGQILGKTREMVIQEFEKSDEEVKDGMDIALCSLEGNTLLYAGAHNPLWIIRKGEVLETKANKQPIGQFDNPLPYTTHTFELQDGDTIYIFSDGYVDQFGGEKGKKLKAANMRKLLLSIQDKNMEEQRVLIDEAFESWRGDIEQVDDVCMIGVRV
jgi:serine phosphatase RsbU (regulator of sigma subunit)/Tfp pilus assembly protein PilF